MTTRAATCLEEDVRELKQNFEDLKSLVTSSTQKQLICLEEMDECSNLFIMLTSCTGVFMSVYLDMLCYFYIIA